MPFVPLGSRKRIEVILDDDKEQIATAQRTRDSRTMTAHFSLAPSNSGYRFGNHPMTRGDVRPEVPFKNAPSSWRPPSADPDGPASRKDREQTGSAIWNESHRMRKTLSSPALSKTNMTVPFATHPLTKEIERWEKLSQFTEAREMTSEVKEQRPTRSMSTKPEVRHRPGMLVNFPKYMLINNCHLKQMEQQRFQREAEQQRMAELPESTTESPFMSQEFTGSAVEYGKASWGAPLLKQPGHHWAGHGMAAGRCQRTSNPFRMG
mmetsp:Transcript_104685/g.291575  ORF Transcript_104685/g.291575 Transcript_104685/m.291575 type:complete len:264 (-) Transcript_104685:59-850(-)